MDLKNAIQGALQDRKKKFLLIGLIIFFLLFVGAGAVIYFSSNFPGSANTNGQLLSDIQSLTPPDTAPHITASKQAPIINLSTDHAAIAPGKSATISWDTKNTTDCVNSDGDSVALTGSISVSPSAPLTFDLLCTGPNGTDMQSVSVDVTSAPIITLSASPRAVVAGGQSTISWTTINADRCVDEKNQTLRLEGTSIVTPKAAYTFSMSCVGPNGASKKSITVAIATATSAGSSGGGITGGGSGATWTVGDTTVTPDTSDTSSADVASVVLSATVTDVPYKGSTTIIWGLQNVSYCVFTSDGPLGDIPVIPYYSGSSVVPSMTKSQQYTVTCTKGSEKITKTVAVSVGAPPKAENANVTFNVVGNHNYVATNNEIRFTWTTKNAIQCSLLRDSTVIKANLGANASYSDYPRKAGRYVYALSCINADKVAEPSIEIPVDVVDCFAQYGFSDRMNQATPVLATGYITPNNDSNMAVEDIDGKAMCTYTYGQPTWMWEDFSKLFNGAQGGSRQSNPPPIDPKKIVPNGSMNLCQYTYYTQKTINGVVYSLGYFDTSYHNNWKTIVAPPASPRIETHNKTVHYNQTGSCGYISYNCNPAHDVTGPVTGVSSLKCQVIN